MTDNAPYWPNGFFAELYALFKEVPDEESRSTKLAEMHSRAAEELTADSIAQPRRAMDEHAAQQVAFEAHLEARWGSGLDLADLVIHKALESGRWVNDLLHPEAATRGDQKFEALIRLHGKAVMTAREVLVLLRSGYSSGAFARWRTLHEVWVIFMLLYKGDSELSRRYLYHEVVESLKGQEEYERSWQTLGHEPPDWTDAERADMRQELKTEFGPAFLKDYGWAAPLFNDTAPKFNRLAERANLDHWRSYYRMSSHGIHANPKGISWNIQSRSTVNVVWAGPSDVGLVDPAQCTLIALTGITVMLMFYTFSELSHSVDHGIVEKHTPLIKMHEINLLRDHAIKTIVELGDQHETDSRYSQ